MARAPKPRGPGRPSLGADARDVVLRLRVTADEAEAIRGLARADGVSMSELVRRRVLVLCLALASGCAGASGWTVAGHVGLGVQTAALACDWGQTRRAASAGWKTQAESNPLMGREPTTHAVDAYFLGTIAASALVWYVLPKRWKVLVPLAIVAVQADSIAHNARAQDLGMCGVR